MRALSLDESKPVIFHKAAWTDQEVGNTKADDERHQYREKSRNRIAEKLEVQEK